MKPNRRIVNYLEKNDLFYTFQYGFRELHSTHDAVFKLLEIINKSKDDRQHSLVCFLDIRKAFNCVDHTVLLQIFQKLGFGGKVLDWVSDFLSNRKQFVNINGSISRELTLLDGVPQGSVLGPIFYLVYVNFIGSIGLEIPPLLFADDTAIIVKGNSPQECCEKMEGNLLIVNKFLTDLKLTLNYSKCKIMHFNPYWIGTKSPKISVSIGNVELETVDTFTYLGIVVDKNLNFKDHAAKCIRDTWLKLSRFGRLRHCLSDQVAIDFYKTMILPTLEFGNIFCDSCPENIKSKLQRLQNRGLKIALKHTSRYPTFNLHYEANLSSWQKRADIAQVILCFRYLLKESKLPNNDVRGVCWVRGGGYLTTEGIDVVQNMIDLYFKLNPAIAWILRLKSNHPL